MCPCFGLRWAPIATASASVYFTRRSQSRSLLFFLFFCLLLFLSPPRPSSPAPASLPRAPGPAYCSHRPFSGGSRPALPPARRRHWSLPRRQSSAPAPSARAQQQLPAARAAAHGGSPPGRLSSCSAPPCAWARRLLSLQAEALPSPLAGRARPEPRGWGGVTVPSWVPCAHALPKRPPFLRERAGTPGCSRTRLATRAWARWRFCAPGGHSPSAPPGGCRGARRPGADLRTCWHAPGPRLPPHNTLSSTCPGVVNTQVQDGGGGVLRKTDVPFPPTLLDTTPRRPLPGRGLPPPARRAHSSRRSGVPL